MIHHYRQGGGRACVRAAASGRSRRGTAADGSQVGAHLGDVGGASAVAAAATDPDSASCQRHSPHYRVVPNSMSTNLFLHFFFSRIFN